MLFIVKHTDQRRQTQARCLQREAEICEKTFEKDVERKAYKMRGERRDYCEPVFGMFYIWNCARDSNRP